MPGDIASSAEFQVALAAPLVNGSNSTLTPSPSFGNESLGLMRAVNDSGKQHVITPMQHFEPASNLGGENQNVLTKVVLSLHPTENKYELPVRGMTPTFVEVKEVPELILESNKYTSYLIENHTVNGKLNISMRELFSLQRKKGILVGLSYENIIQLFGPPKGNILGSTARKKFYKPTTEFLSEEALKTLDHQVESCDFNALKHDCLVARHVCETRRNIKEYTRGAGDLFSHAYAENLDSKRHGDQMGQTCEAIFKKHKGNATAVIESAGRRNKEVDRFTGVSSGGSRDTTKSANSHSSWNGEPVIDQNVYITGSGRTPTVEEYKARKAECDKPTLWQRIVDSFDVNKRIENAAKKKERLKK